MPLTRAVKEGIVLCNILLAAIYGVEASHVNIAALQSLRSAIASAIGPSSSKRNVDLLFDCRSCTKDLDPIAHILYERIAALRRMMATHIGNEVMIRLLIKR